MAPPVRSRTNTRGVRARCTNRYTKGDGRDGWARTSDAGVKVPCRTTWLHPYIKQDTFFSIVLPLYDLPKASKVGLEPTTHSVYFAVRVFDFLNNIQV